jgi:hypothetical protein
MKPSQSEAEPVRFLANKKMDIMKAIIVLVPELNE